MTTEDMKQALKKAEEEAGARSFTVLLSQLADGEAVTQLGDDMHRLTKECAKQAKARNGTVKGSLTLKINVVVDEKGTAVIGYQVERKEPAPKRATTVLWVDKTDNLTATNPRQIELGLRDVSRNKGTRDVAAPVQDNAREV